MRNAREIAHEVIGNWLEDWPNDLRTVEDMIAQGVEVDRASRVTPPGENNYEQIEAMPAGTIFQFEDGCPWMRTTEGVADLLPYLVERGQGISKSIPENWRSMRYNLVILHLGVRDD